MIKLSVSKGRALNTAIAVISLICGVALIILSIDHAYSFNSKFFAIWLVLLMCLILTSTLLFFMSAYYFNFITFKGDSNEGNL